MVTVPDSASRRDWEALPADPDDVDDLGYARTDLEVHETDGAHLLVLPKEEDMLREDAFVVIRKSDMRPVVE